MSKEEFLDRLRMSLNGEVPDRVLQENLLYYHGYILDEVNKGRAEELVLEELGDPRLIARTIIDSLGISSAGNEDYFRGNADASKAYTDQTYEKDSTMRQFQMSQKRLKLIGWSALAVVILILFLVFWLIGGILSLLAPILPIVFMVWVVIWLMRMFRS